jgi:hypothetical protein
MGKTTAAITCRRITAFLVRTIIWKTIENELLFLVEKARGGARDEM